MCENIIVCTRRFDINSRYNLWRNLQDDSTRAKLSDVRLLEFLQYKFEMSFDLSKKVSLKCVRGIADDFRLLDCAIGKIDMPFRDYYIAYCGVSREIREIAVLIASMYGRAQPGFGSHECMCVCGEILRDSCAVSFPYDYSIEDIFTIARCLGVCSKIDHVNSLIDWTRRHNIPDSAIWKEFHKGYMSCNPRERIENIILDMCSQDYASANRCPLQRTTTRAIVVSEKSQLHDAILGTLLAFVSVMCVAVFFKVY